MRRLVYRPTVEAYVRLNSTGKIVNLTSDIVSGSVTKNLNAVSQAELVLQNKFGKYTGSIGIKDSPLYVNPGVIIQPMDRIIILMSRYGDPFPVFTGYVDTADVYQLYPDTVNISCTCSLKTLQYTFFDPGLPFLTKFFSWATDGSMTYDFTSGAVIDSAFRLGNQDVQGGIGKILYAVMTEIAGWNPKTVHVKAFPKKFLNRINKLMLKDQVQEAQQVLRVEQYLTNILTGNGVDSTNAASNTDPNTIPDGGNMSGSNVAIVAQKAGFKGDDLVIAVALAQMESGWNSSIGNINPGDGGTGLWQITPTEPTTFENSTLNSPTGLARTITLCDPTTHKPNGPTIHGVVDRNGSNGKPVMSAYLSPLINARAAYAIYDPSKSTAQERFGPWSLDFDGPHTLRDKAALNNAQSAVQHINNPNADRNSILYQSGSGQTTTNYSPATKKNYGSIVSSTMHFAGVDQGIDFTGPGDIYALDDGKVLKVMEWHIIEGATVPVIMYQITNPANPKNGWNVYIMEDLKPLVNKGDKIQRGQIIAKATGGQYGIEMGWANDSATAPLATLGSNPHGPTSAGYDFQNFVLGRNAVTSPIAGSGGASGGTNGGSTGNNGPLTASQVAGVSATTSFYLQQLETTDAGLAMMLDSKHALANTIPVLEWVVQLITSSGRVFTSAPNGDFYAFYPDYFGWFGTAPYLDIKDIEVTNLQVAVSDVNLTTHLYAVGSMYGYTSPSTFDFMQSAVASVQDDAFNYFMNTEVLNRQVKDKKGKKPKAFKAIEFLKIYGARPQVLEYPQIRNPVLLWMTAWLQFCLAWAQRFQANAEFTFMPEVLPGGRVRIADRIELFVQSVTHNFDMEGGFSTTAELIAPQIPDGNNINKTVAAALNDMVVGGVTSNFGKQIQDVSVGWWDGTPGQPLP